MSMVQERGEDRTGIFGDGDAAAHPPHQAGGITAGIKLNPHCKIVQIKYF